MSETILPRPSGSSILASTITLTPSPTTIFITDRTTFTTILALSTLTQSLIYSPLPPTPPPPPPESLPISGPDRNFIILLSITGASFIVLILLAFISLYFLRLYRKSQKQPSPTSEPPNSGRMIETPALTSFPLPPATPRVTAADTNAILPMPLSLFEFTASGDERARPITAPPTRPHRSASTPFLGAEYENKMFTPPTQSRYPPPTPLPQLPKSSSSKTPPSLSKPIKSTLPAVPPSSEDSWKLPPQKMSTPPRFTEEETQIGEPEAVASWFGIPREGREFEEHRETFDFFRFPIGGEAVGTRASSGVFPEERERWREVREDG